MNQTDGYNMSLIFGSSAGLKNGDDVKISGINVERLLNWILIWPITMPKSISSSITK